MNEDDDIKITPAQRNYVLLFELYVRHWRTRTEPNNLIPPLMDICFNEIMTNEELTRQPR